jgi:hypothetical protein
MAELAQVTDQGLELIPLQVIENVPGHDDVEASVLGVGQQVLENRFVSESVLWGEKIEGAEGMIKILYINLAGELGKKIHIGPQCRSQVQNMIFFLVAKLIVKDVKG